MVFFEWRKAFVHVSHNDRQVSIFPIFGLGVDETVKLIGGNSLRINDFKDSIPFARKVEGISKNFPDC
jgi:hypothetical protein